MRILKFFITGTIGLSLNLGAFRTLYVFGVPYITGSVTAFLMSMCIGFLLQKYWTFDEPTQGRFNEQFISYAILAVCNLTVNTLIIFVFVEYTNIHYLLAQTIGAGLVACVSYFIYSSYIFTNVS